MDSSRSVLLLDKPEEAMAWLVSFEAMCRSKEIKDVKGDDGTFLKTDKFLERCGTKALLKIISLMPGRDIEKQQFSEIKNTIKNYIQPTKRLVIADRTRFFMLKQEENESEIDYLARLNEASTHCKWEELTKCDPATELTKLRFIAGMSHEGLKIKVLERLQLNPSMTITEIIEFCQINGQLKDFVHGKTKTTDQESDKVETFASQMHSRQSERNLNYESQKEFQRRPKCQNVLLATRFVIAQRLVKSAIIAVNPTTLPNAAGWHTSIRANQRAHTMLMFFTANQFANLEILWN